MNLELRKFLMEYGISKEEFGNMTEDEKRQLYEQFKKKNRIEGLNKLGKGLQGLGCLIMLLPLLIIFLIILIGFIVSVWK